MATFPEAIRRQTNQTYVDRREDGSYATRFFHEVVDGDRVTLFHGRGAADFLAETINAARLSQALRAGKAANDATLLAEAA